MTTFASFSPIRFVNAYVAPSRFRRAVVLLVATIATLAGAWFIELVLNYPPCKLCLIQRWPYYAALPLALMAAIATGAFDSPRAARPAFGALGIVFMLGAGLGAYHAGVEWGWWLGPADCGGRLNTGPASAVDLIQAMNATRVISCSEPAFRILGLSLAGWNALISFGLASMAIRGFRR